MGEPINKNCIKGAFYIYYKKGGLTAAKESFLDVMRKARN
jgi:hypothetical protein